MGRSRVTGPPWTLASRGTARRIPRRSYDADARSASRRLALADPRPVGHQTVDRHDVNGEDAQRPEWVSRHHQQLGDRVEAQDHHAGPASKLVLDEHSEPDQALQ